MSKDVALQNRKADLHHRGTPMSTEIGSGSGDTTTAPLLERITEVIRQHQDRRECDCDLDNENHAAAAVLAALNLITDCFRCSNDHYWATKRKKSCPAEGCSYGQEKP
jgi:hypothetical protein